MLLSLVFTTTIFLYLVSKVPRIVCSTEEFRLLADLRDGYDPVERPAQNHSKPLKVKFRLILQQITDVDEKNQAMTVVVWTQITWNDYKLSWAPREYGNITSIEIPKKNLWRPDILLFNSVNDNFDASYPVQSVVSHNGDVFLSPPGIAKVSCDMPMTWFPFDEQLCHLKYGSWTYKGQQLDLDFDNTELTSENMIDTKYSVANEEFEILGTPGLRKVQHFAGESYIELYFFIRFRRRPLYYAVNWVVPSVLLAMSNVLQFMMPTAGGEKITLQTTNILAILFFLSSIAKVTPPISDSIPILACVFSATLCIMGASTMATCLIMNIHFRNPALKDIGPWFAFEVRSVQTRWVFFDILPGMLFIEIEKTENEEDEESQCLLEKQKCVNRLEEENNASLENLCRRGNEMCDAFERHQRLFNTLSTALTEIQRILKEFEEYLVSGRKERKIASDWQIVATVLDRLCLFLYFSLFFTVFAILASNALLQWFNHNKGDLSYSNTLLDDLQNLTTF